MAVFCVHLLNNSSWKFLRFHCADRCWKFHQHAAGQLLSGQPVLYGRDWRYGPSIAYNITPVGSFSSSHPGGPPCWTSPLAFGLIGYSAGWPTPIGQHCICTFRKNKREKVCKYNVQSCTKARKTFAPKGYYWTLLLYDKNLVTFASGEENNQVFSWKAFLRNAKTKVETLSLSNPKIMPGNLNEIVLSRIPSLAIKSYVSGKFSSLSELTRIIWLAR